MYANAASRVIKSCVSTRKYMRCVRLRTLRRHKLRVIASSHLNANEEESARPNLFEMKTYFRLVPWSNIPERGRTNESIINVKNDLLASIIRSEMHN